MKGQRTLKTDERQSNGTYKISEINDTTWNYLESVLGDTNHIKHVVLFDGYFGWVGKNSP